MFSSYLSSCVRLEMGLLFLSCFLLLLLLHKDIRRSRRKTRFCLLPCDVQALARPTRWFLEKRRLVLTVRRYSSPFAVNRNASSLVLSLSLARALILSPLEYTLKKIYFRLCQSYCFLHRQRARTTRIHQNMTEEKQNALDHERKKREERDEIDGEERRKNIYTLYISSEKEKEIYFSLSLPSLSPFSHPLARSFDVLAFKEDIDEGKTRH